MRIIQVCPYDLARPGGVQAHVRDLSAWLTRQGHETRIVAPYPVTGPPLSGVDHCGRARLVSLFSTRFEISLAGRAEVRALAGELGEGWKADLVHLHTPWTPLMAWQVWRGLRLPSVATFHATLPDPGDRGISARLLRHAANHFLDRSRALIVPSATPLAHLRPEARGIAAHVLPPSVDLSAWRMAGQTRGPKGAGCHIVFLGRFEERKGLDVLLAAWPDVARQGDDIRLTVAGGGTLEPLVHAAMAGPFGGRIAHLPTPDDAAARALVASADVLAAPSRFGESFGIVLIEAMAAGAVPVAAANPGYASVMTGELSGLLVPPGDAPALAERLLELCRAQDQRARFAELARARASGFDIAATGPEFLAVYERALRETAKR